MSDLYDKEVYTLLKMGGQKALENQYKNISRRLDNISEENRALKKQIAESEYKISELEKQVENYKQAFGDKCNDFKFISDLLEKFMNENEELNRHIAELESKETGKPTKINLNDRVKVKLTPFGAEIYYHQYDDINKDYPKMKKHLQSSLPKVDENGYTEFQLWHFMELYEEHIGMCKPNVIEPLNIVVSE